MNDTNPLALSAPDTAWSEYPGMCSGEGKHFSLTDPSKHPGMSEYHTITWPNICWLALNPQHVQKDRAWWVIPSVVHDRPARLKHHQYAHGEFWMLTADLDKGNLDLATVVDGVRRIMDPGVEFLVYATASSADWDKKWRIMAPTAGAIPAQAFHHAAGVFNEALGLVLGVSPDPVTERINQYLYLPNTGLHYEYHIEPGLPWGGTEEVSAARALTAKAIERVRNDPDRAAALERSKERGAYLTAFAHTYPVAVLLERYGFETLDGKNWHHPDWQTTKSFGTTITDEGTWVTASQSVEEKFGRKGGDSFDIFVAMEAGGDWKKAYAALVTRMPIEYDRPWGELGFYCNGEYVEAGQ